MSPAPSRHSHQDLAFMRRALRLAAAAARRGEVPVGAVAVLEGRAIAGAGNRVERMQDASAHAELLLLRRLSRQIGSWRLTGITIYTTLEPCPMCAGALLLARVDRVVYAAPDPRKGASGSVYQVLRHPGGNHHPAVDSGCEAEASQAILQSFFRDLRRSAPPAPGLG